MERIKTTCKELLPIWEKLQDILLEYRKYSPKIERALNALGIRTRYNGNHFILYIGDRCVITLASTGCINTGRVALRDIRRFYENQ